MRQILPFGKYLLLERISVGGMAEVFRAKAVGNDVGGGKIIAIKRILPSMSEDADFIQMFIDEARISGQLSHAHIAQIYELGRVGDAHFIAMEYVWGKDLLQLQNRFRRQKQTMPLPMAAFIAAKLAEALDYAHRKKGPDGKGLGIIHRDVSPQNVLVSYQGEVKVIDFGIAKAASRSTKTQAGVLKGKFGYMSPEQVAGVPLDHRSDVFAIGTILYELLTADRLFVAESDFATLEKVRNVDVQPPRAVVPACPPELERIILRALSKDPAQRYQWASELQHDLTAWLATLPRPFGARDLSAWMSEQFAAEHKRESQAIEEQLQAAAELAKAPATLSAAAAQAQSIPLTLDDDVKPASGTQEINTEELESLLADNPLAEDNDLSAEATQITNVSVAALMAAGASPNAIAAAAAGGADLTSESTRILSPGEVQPALAAAMAAAAPPELPSQATAILDTSSMKLPPLAAPAPAPIPRQPTPIVAPPAPPPRPATGAHRPITIPPEPSGPIVQRPPTGAHRPVSQLEANPPTTRVDALPYAGRRSTLWKDIAIGLGLAALLAIVAIGARLYMTRSPAGGALVIGVVAPARATVTVDDQERGQVDSGGALTLKEVQPGTHKVRVTAPGEPPFEHAATVQSGEVAAVIAVLGTVKGSVEEKKAEPPAAAPMAPAPPAPAVEKKVEPAAPTAVEKVAEKAPAKAAPVEKPAPAEKPAPVEKAPVAKAEKPAPVEKAPAAKAPVEKAPAEKPAAPAEAAKPAAADAGFLVANTQPYAKVLIDGKDTGKSTPISPRSKIPLKPGKHVVTFVVEGSGKKYNFDIEIKPGEDTKLIKPLE